MFDTFIERLHNEINTHDINIIEDTQSDITASVKDNILEQGEDTLTFLGNYVDQIDTDLDRNKLKTYIKELHTEVNE